MDSLYSKILQEQRTLWIHVPEDMDTSKRYPVIYILDATDNFYLTVGLLKKLQPWKIPESIIVGINNTDRTKDFTPTKVKRSRGKNTSSSGGAKQFLRFINEELKPHLSSKLPTEDHHTIIGHSTAGLFVVYSYLNAPSSFDNYIALDPSLWWDKENLVKKSEKLLSSEDRKDNELYIAVANSLGPALDTKKVGKDKSEPTEQIRANLKFHDLLIKNKDALSFKWEYFHNEDHGEVVVPGIYNGLRSVFQWFPFEEMWRFNAPKSYSIEELINPYHIHFDKLSKKMKREVKPDWQLINDIADYMLQGHNLPKKALAFYQLNKHYYPKESRTFVSLGDFYHSRKDKDKAIGMYQKAIDLDGNEEAVTKLKKLK